MKLAKPVTTGHPFIDSGATTHIYGRLRRICAVCDGFDSGAIHDRPFCEKQRWGWCSDPTESVTAPTEVDPPDSDESAP